MKLSNLTTVRLAMAAACAAAGLTMVAPAAAAAPKPPAAADYGRLPAFSSLTLSPDGKHLAALTSPDGRTTYVSIWRTAAMQAAPTVFATDPRAPAVSVNLVKNDRLVIRSRQTYTESGIKTHLFKLQVVDLNGKEIPLVRTGGRQTEIERYVDSVSSPEILSDLPNDPQHILIINTSLTGAGGVEKVNLYTRERETLVRGTNRFAGYQPDLKGDVRARQELSNDGNGAFIQQWIRHPDTGAWEAHFRWYAKNREPMSIVGFTTDPNIAYVATNKGSDKIFINEYDIRARKILEPVFQHKLFDAGGVILSDAKEDFGDVLGFTYLAERTKIHWIDPRLKAVDDGLQKALGIKEQTVDWVDPGTGAKSRIKVAADADVSIVDWSQDRRLVIVEKSGPKQPPEYYLLADGSQLKLLGRSYPSIDPAALGDTRLVQYPARDGLMIPAFLTTPDKTIHGPGPYPSIIVPHGGPWSRDNMEWDTSGWTQYFAARGYAVLQPQFRGSEGWGQKLWRAGDGEWGQKMQDDKDDGAKWLISQKIAAPERIAMHGYSYGGYSAFAAGVRPNGLYQCAIAGAGVAELGSFQRETRENRFQREFQAPTIAGLDPLTYAGSVSIPMLIYHGDRDQTVPLKQSTMFSSKLRGGKKPFKYLELKDMGHGYVTWGPEDAGTVLTAIDSFLKNHCGPGGL